MFKKILIVLMIGCFLLGMATKAEVENVKEEVESEVVKSETNPEMGAQEPLIKPSEEPALYKTSLNVQTPDEGIATGHVIAYGHYIKPPYKVEIKNDTMLFVNGIQLLPILPSKIKREEARRTREKDKEAIDISEPYRKRLRALINKGEKLYKEITPKKGREAAVKAFSELLKEDSLMVDVKVVSRQKEYVLLEVQYYLPGLFMPPGDPLGELVELSMSSSEPAPTISNEERNEKRLKNKKRSFVNLREGTEADLKEGKVIIISGSWFVGFEMDFLRIVRVLRDTNQTFNQKLEKLCSRDIGFIENEAKELLYNYNPDEWPEFEKENE